MGLLLERDAHNRGEKMLTTGAGIVFLIPSYSCSLKILKFNTQAKHFQSSVLNALLLQGC